MAFFDVRVRLAAQRKCCDYLRPVALPFGKGLKYLDSNNSTSSKIRSARLQVFELLSKLLDVLPQQDCCVKCRPACHVTLDDF